MRVWGSVTICVPCHQKLREDPLPTSTRHPRGRTSVILGLIGSISESLLF